mmetsp:Transcript_10794/g.28019  ORF Transcript_10794/g.28019 Transcript_10794/m.28019 type:complete len:209 (+) Transcript_10794:436-1062(+)
MRRVAARPRGVHASEVGARDARSGDTGRANALRYSAQRLVRLAVAREPLGLRAHDGRCAEVRRLICICKGRTLPALGRVLVLCGLDNGLPRPVGLELHLREPRALRLVEHVLEPRVYHKLLWSRGLGAQRAHPARALHRAMHLQVVVQVKALVVGARLGAHRHAHPRESHRAAQSEANGRLLEAVVVVFGGVVVAEEDAEDPLARVFQ